MTRSKVKSPSPLSGMHPAVAGWFEDRFTASTETQSRGWRYISHGEPTLISAPTGSGKTLTAFLVCLNELLEEGLEKGELPDETRVVYISPLKALSHDIQKNLTEPLEGIRARAQAFTDEEPPFIRTAVRTGDTKSHVRQSMVKKPPHILVTTPESLYILLTAEKSRAMLSTVRTVIVDEIHALAQDKRGSHLSLSLARLDGLTKRPPQRIGLSATQKPLEGIARFLVGRTPWDDSVGENPPRCRIVDSGHSRDLDLGVEVPETDLSAVCSHDQWDEVHKRLADLIQSHRSTLIFVNTRKLAERTAFQLRGLLGEEAVAAHHGSLARERRFAVEDRLKRGELKAIVATASLELGLDIGYIDLVCQIGSPRRISSCLQRIGRSGHTLGARPKGRIFALTRDELLESLALVQAVRAGHLDETQIPEAPLDILAQQIVAEVACGEWDERELFELFRCASPYEDLSWSDYEATLEMLSRGYGGSGRKTALIHRDRMFGTLRPRRSTRLTAVTNGGAIPDQADYRVVNEADGATVGSLNEDFAIESNAGDIFLLGNTSWQILFVRGGEVRVRDAEGAPPTVPFWFGEAPGRSPELSTDVSSLREGIAERINLETLEMEPLPLLEGSLAPHLDPLPKAYIEAIEWLRMQTGTSPWSALQAVHYVATEKSALGVVPTTKRLVYERFFDETGGMQLVIHAPFGSRINRGLGLALRKRFCRSFDFELQASADDDGIVLSVGPQHSFPIEQMFSLINAQTLRGVLEQAVLAIPMFQVRWRWNGNRALAVERHRGGRKVPPPLQRFRSDDFLSSVFPAQTQCQENQTGPIEIPEHPLVRQTLRDCLEEAIDLPGLTKLVAAMESGGVELVARDTREPSPFCYERLNAAPYAFLDDAPLEERRARAVSMRRSLPVDDLRELGRLDPEAIATVEGEAAPLVRDPDELHDHLLTVGVVPEAEGQDWTNFFETLRQEGRALRATTATTSGGTVLWIGTEARPLAEAAYGELRCEPDRYPPAHAARKATQEEAIRDILRGHLEISGIVTAETLGSKLGLPASEVTAALASLEHEGSVVRGKFSSPDAGEQWCHRRLLMRIHKRTLEGLRQRIKPVAGHDYLQFLFAWQGLTPTHHREGKAGLLESLLQLQGVQLPAGVWEEEAFPSRVASYDPKWLDELCYGGKVTWGRLQGTTTSTEGGGTGLHRGTSVALVIREDLGWLLPPGREAPSAESLSEPAERVLEVLSQGGALFADELRAKVRLLPSQLETALGELAARGLAHSDGFEAVRPFISRERKQKGRNPRRNKTPRWAGSSTGTAPAGRWAAFPPFHKAASDEDRAELWARLLLKRYGVVAREMLEREKVAPPWASLVRAFRQLEARGEIRGGRFVAGLGGEQYALADCVKRLRSARAGRDAPTWVILSATDPANLAGIVTGDPRVPSSANTRVAYRSGKLVATYGKEGLSLLDDREIDQATRNWLDHQMRLWGPFRH